MKKQSTLFAFKFRVKGEKDKADSGSTVPAKADSDSTVHSKSSSDTPTASGTVNTDSTVTQFPFAMWVDG